MARSTYTLWDELLASPIEPMAVATRTHQLTRMWQGLAAIERDPAPTVDDWRVCSDAVNLLETLVAMGQLHDEGGLLADGIRALAEAGKRAMRDKTPIRLDARGIQALRAVLEDYAASLEALPARTMIRAHRLTEKRIQAILQGKQRPHDLEVVDL